MVVRLTFFERPAATDSRVVKEEWKDRFALTAEDYLHGLITLVNELVGHDVFRNLPLPNFVLVTVGCELRDDGQLRRAD